MLRRSFLQIAATARPRPLEGSILTVRGPIRPEELDLALPHEHLFSNFGLDPADPPVYDTPRLMREVLRYVSSVRFLGCNAIFDGTAQYFGRAPELLRRISEGTRVHVITNTGYYGAANGRYIPVHAFDESAGAVAARWAAEFHQGIGGTGIRPGFIKLGIDAGPLNAINAKLLRAAAITHRQTGLTLAVHTGDNAAAAREQLAILREEGVSPEAWIWIHADNSKDLAPLLEAAKAGAWISVDGIAQDNVASRVAIVRRFKDARLLGRVLLSHDGNSFRANGTRPLKPYSALFTHLLPALRHDGFTPGELRLLTETNPARAFTVRPRTA